MNKGFAEFVIIFMITLLFVSILSFRYLGSNNSATTSEPASELSIDQLELIEQTDPSLDSYSIELPENFTEKEFVRLYTKEDLTQQYDDLKDSDCPGICSLLTEEGRLDEQFEILESVSNLQDCKITSDLENDIIERFILFESGPGYLNKHQIEGIYNENIDACGLRHVGGGGFDLWIGNYSYKAVFLKENKIIRIGFPLYEYGRFDFIDEILIEIGLVDGSCDSECYANMVDYMESMNFQEPEILRLIDIGDSSARSFTFL